MSGSSADAKFYKLFSINGSGNGMGGAEMILYRQNKPVPAVALHYNPVAACPGRCIVNACTRTDWLAWAGLAGQAHQHGKRVCACGSVSADIK